MKTEFCYLLTALCAYLIGCSNMALYLSKAKNIDLRNGGSGNLGASNAMVRMGWKAAIIVGAHDIGKGFLAVFIAKLVFPGLQLIGAAAGVACVLGHIFPFYLRFRGGKGFAAYLGMTLALNWQYALILMAVVVILLIVTDYIVVGTVTTMLATPVYLGISDKSWIIASILCVASLVILWKHRENYVRIWNGTEIGLRGANRGDHRVTKQ